MGHSFFEKNNVIRFHKKNSEFYNSEYVKFKYKLGIRK